ncbi:hypothetical protein H2202_010833 [Exophiala xenobiotica]|nr:hypothetical protein H2202_010833 [Exophiala xenobiotica]
MLRILSSRYKFLKSASVRKLSSLKTTMLAFSMSYASGKIKRRLNLDTDNLRKKKPVANMTSFSSFKIRFGTILKRQIASQAALGPAFRDWTKSSPL